MPSAPLRLCAQPGCPVRVPRGRCPQHQRDRNRQIERTRGTATQRGYDQDWQRVRAAVLADEPLCRACRTAGRVSVAREVDHIVPLAHGGARLDRANLQPLCRGCHHTKTARENGRRG